MDPSLKDRVSKVSKEHLLARSHLVKRGRSQKIPEFEARSVSSHPSDLRHVFCIAPSYELASFAYHLYILFGSLLPLEQALLAYSSIAYPYT